MYVGTPHSFHRKNCLDAIAAGKHVLCEKAFAINAAEVKEIIEAAQKSDVYVAEAMWLRHRPLVAKLRDLIFEKKAIGDVFRTFSDFGMEVDFANLQEGNRYKHIHLGAGTLLDIGLYALTWAFLTLDPGTPENSEMPTIQANQSHNADGIEVSSSILLQYPSSGKQGIVTSSHVANSSSNIFCTVEGTKGYIEVEGFASSFPSAFTVYPARGLGAKKWLPSEGRRYDFGHAEFHRPDRGFAYEADNTALDLAAGRKQSTIMPLHESLRVMSITDEIRRQGKTKYPQDGW